MKFKTVLQRIEQQRPSPKRVDEKLLGSSNADSQLDVVDGHESIGGGDFVNDMVDELHEVFDENLASRNSS